MRSLSARSVVLSLMLGAHPPELPVSNLVSLVGEFGISGSTLRVALTRMVAAGDLERTDAVYRLSPRLLARQQRQDADLAPEQRDWDGTWEMVVIAQPGRSAGERAALRAELTALRLAEYREGVWLRPANLARILPAWSPDLIAVFTDVRQGEPDRLVEHLWDLPHWNQETQELLAALAGTSEPAERLTVAAAAVRHLRTDPTLPPGLLPEDWSGDALRSAYAAYQVELVGHGIELALP